MSSAASDPISYTARIVAAKRAIEQSHPGRLFEDPYAALLAGDEVENLLVKWREVARRQDRPLEDVIVKRTRYIAIRTRFFDDLLRSALSETDNSQIVILGAGLDTRAFRFGWPLATHVYEVDHPEVLNYKVHALQNHAPTCQHHLIPGDLTDAQASWVKALLDQGFQSTNPTIWLLEGVVMYLPEPSAHALLKRLSLLSSAGSVLGMDGVTVGSIAAAQRAQKADRGRVVRHWEFGHDDPNHLLADYGWSAEISQPQDIGSTHDRYPRSLPIEAEVGGNQDKRGVWLVSARKRE
ncbi:SAM-dependent methyltransferase [Pseudanabaena sp. FACHB-2040]|uniref:SAM-dependent methyltransferase n=1 Tax=Pseudanabaena sp. FACHB-2040 TaxID=2692859 RepID=UPI001689B4AA|nr:SAM-dependent methyltransferase [Pseudanabaena sp. FACHB-2040]